MGHRIKSLIGAATISLLLAAPAVAAPPDRFEDHFTISFPDVERGLVILVNTTRDQYCTPDVVAWELAVAQWIIDWEAWFEGGQVGPEPPFPDDPPGGFPAGNDPLHVQLKETGQGALVLHLKAQDLDAEIWPMVDNPPLIGACTDTDPSDTPLVGTADVLGNDNDLEASGTRGNSFGDQGTIRGRDSDGDPFRYSWRFHVNDQCYAPDDGPPACLIEQSSFQTH
jgi:hypothetical protein